jgi:hypothetical protein
VCDPETKVAKIKSVESFRSYETKPVIPKNTDSAVSKTESAPESDQNNRLSLHSMKSAIVSGGKALMSKVEKAGKEMMEKATEAIGQEHVTDDDGLDKASAEKKMKLLSYFMAYDHMYSYPGAYSYEGSRCLCCGCFCNLAICQRAYAQHCSDM